MRLESLLQHASNVNNMIVAVAAADNLNVIEAVSEALNRNLAQFLLFGNEKVLNEMIKTQGIKNKEVQIIHANNKEEAADLAVKAIQHKQASILMKGNIPTAMLLKSVLKKEHGLKTDKILSHVAMFDIPTYSKSLIVTDAAMNIHPDLLQKSQIIENAVNVAIATGNHDPKVAILAAVETINSSMQASLDAAILTQMNRRGQIKGCVIDGPLALDNAISELAAKQKQIESEVAGKADILLVPNIEAGNVLYKSLIYFGQAKVAAMITGAKAPIVLTSRSDTTASKLYSLALAICSLDMEII